MKEISSIAITNWDSLLPVQATVEPTTIDPSKNALWVKIPDWVDLNVWDIEIGAVELKDGTSDNRAIITNRWEVMSWKIAYQTLIDESLTNISYIWKSLPGSLASEAKRQIRKIDDTATPVTIKRADVWNFTQVWNNRVSLTYS